MPSAHPRLVLEGPIPREFPLSDVTRLGRNPESDIRIHDDNQVSRDHAKIVREGDVWFIVDLQSRNGVTVNNIRVNNRQQLRHGDMVTLGRTTLKFHQPPALQTPQQPGFHAPQPGFHAPLPAPQPVASRPPAPAAAPAKPDQGTIIAELSVSADDLFMPSENEDLAEIRKANANLKTIYAISEALAGETDLDKVLSIVLEQVFKVVKCDRGVIFLHNEKDNSLFRSAQRSNDPNETGDVPVSQTILKYVLDTKCAVLTSDAGRDARFTEGQSIFIQHIQSAACVPLICRKKVVGVLQVESTVHAQAFSREDLQLLSGIGGQAAVAIENASLLKKAEAEAEIRTNLQRYLPPQLAQQVIQNKLNLQLGGDNTKITILFSDVRGFTRMTEEVGAREVVTTLNSYFSKMVAVIFKHGGTLDKFIGDAIMAFWGAPVAAEDDSLRAVMAAVEMQRELFMLNLTRRQSGKRALHMGLGLNTGEAVVGNMGAPNMMQFTAMGGVVNQASRIEGKTIAGQILISEAMLAEVKDFVRVVEMPPVELKGISGKVPIWSVLGLASDAISPLLAKSVRPRTQTFIRATHATSNRIIEGRGWEDEPTSDFGMVVLEQDAAELKEGDLISIAPTPAGVATTLPPPEEAARAAAALADRERMKRTEISMVPLIFRIGRVVPPREQDEGGTVRLTFARLDEGREDEGPVAPITRA